VSSTSVGRSQEWRRIPISQSSHGCICSIIGDGSLTVELTEIAFDGAGTDGILLEALVEFIIKLYTESTLVGSEVAVDVETLVVVEAVDALRLEVSTVVILVDVLVSTDVP